MSDFTANLALPILLDSQAGAEILIDQSYAILDNVGINASTLSVSLTGLSTYNLTVANQTTGDPGTITTGFLALTGSPSGGVTLQFPLQVGSSTLYVARNGIVINNTTSQVITVKASPSGAVVTIGASAISSIACDGTNIYSTSGGNTFLDATWILKNSTDTTKQFKWDASVITTGNVRTYTMPDKNTNLVGDDTTNTLTHKTFDTGGAGNLLSLFGTSILGTTGAGHNIVLDTSPILDSARLIETSFLGFGIAPGQFNVTASGANQGTAATVSVQICRISSASSGQGVVLLTNGNNRFYFISNSTPIPVFIYPDSGCSIDGLSTNLPVTIAPGELRIILENASSLSFTTTYSSRNQFTPTISAGAGAGTSPTIAISGTDKQFQISLTVGTAPSGSNATIATVTFGETFALTPHPTLTPANATAASLGGTTGIFFDGTSTNTADLTSGTIALPAGTYLWNVTL